MSEESQEAQAPSGEQAQASVQSGSSLLDMGGDTPVTNENPEQVAHVDNGDATPSDWFWSDGIKGDGDKPDWLADRYKTVSDQAKAYRELEKKFGEIKGAPKDGYAFDGMEGVSQDDPLIQHFSQTFKDLNLSQEGFNRVVSEFVNYQHSANQAATQEEMKKLGMDGKQTVNQVRNWVNNTFDDATAKTISQWAITADDIKALDAIRSFMPKSESPTSNDLSNTVSYESYDQVVNEKTKNFDRYKEDVNYRNSITQRLHAAFKREKQQGKR